MCVNKTNKEWLYKEIIEFFFEREKISVTPKMAITLWSIKCKQLLDIEKEFNDLIFIFCKTER